jgi:hypothetical protein
MVRALTFIAPRKRVMAFLTGIALMAALGGCYGTAKPVSAPQRTTVFTEVKEALPPPEGMVHLTLKASVKTPTPEHYLLESRPQQPLDEGFPFELEVDGQEIIWKVKGTLEKTPLSGPEGRLPEGGDGMRYVLDRTIRLAAGPHHVVFGVPYDDYYTEVKISLEEGEAHTLEFQPIYAMGRRGYQTFFRGISRTAVFLDGVRIK